MLKSRKQKNSVKLIVREIQAYTYLLLEHIGNLLMSSKSLEM